MASKSLVEFYVQMFAGEDWGGRSGMMNIWVCRECMQSVFHGCCSIHKKKILWKWWQCPLAQVPTLGVVQEMQTMLHSGSMMTWNFMSLQYWLWSSGTTPIDVNEGRCFCCMLFVAVIGLAFSSHTSSRTHLFLFPCNLHEGKLEIYEGYYELRIFPSKIKDVGCNS